MGEVVDLERNKPKVPNRSLNDQLAKMGEKKTVVLMEKKKGLCRCLPLCDHRDESDHRIQAKMAARQELIKKVYRRYATAPEFDRDLWSGAEFVNRSCKSACLCGPLHGNNFSERICENIVQVPVPQVAMQFVTCSVGVPAPLNLEKSWR